MAPFRSLRARTVRWKPIDGTGLEHLTISAEQDHIVARSVVIGARDDRAFGVYYTIRCTSDWIVRELELRTTTGTTLRLIGDGAGHWRNGKGARLAAFDGCIDIDLAGTPFTNTLPIRRLGIDVGQPPPELRMLYVPFDTFEPTVDEQRYACLESGRRFRYEAVDGSFSADISVDEDGLVTDYPPLFIRVPVHSAS